MIERDFTGIDPVDRAAVEAMPKIELHNHLEGTIRPATMLRLAEKAFRPGRFPFPLLHIDTGHNFPEVTEFRDARAAELGERLVIGHMDDSIRAGRVRLRSEAESRNVHQSVTLLDTIAEHGFDACIGGARRDEEKSRSKERIFSFRDEFGQWDPKNQRPELWSLYNTRVHKGENIRVFPISNWTELDVWQYIGREKLAVPSIYFAHRRDVVRRAASCSCSCAMDISSSAKPSGPRACRDARASIAAAADVSTNERRSMPVTSRAGNRTATRHFGDHADGGFSHVAPSWPQATRQVVSLRWNRRAHPGARVVELADTAT